MDSCDSSNVHLDNNPDVNEVNEDIDDGDIESANEQDLYSESDENIYNTDIYDVDDNENNSKDNSYTIAYEPFDEEYNHQDIDVGDTEESNVELVESEGPLSDLFKEPETSIIPRSSKSLVNIPISRVKQIMKTDPDIHLVNQDAVLLTLKAAELFIKDFTLDSVSVLQQDKRKTIMKKDIDKIIESFTKYEFLEEALDW